jgi:DNA-binding transcriptional ArsR family regulator
MAQGEGPRPRRRSAEGRRGAEIGHASPNELFSTLSDPTRRAIFERLCRDGEQTVRALTDRAGISQPAVSKHLGVLKHAGLMRDRIGLYGAFWRDRFDRLEDLLKRMDQ